jgi:raffinose/stachyose/melibiose transport system permease protein
MTAIEGQTAVVGNAVATAGRPRGPGPRSRLIRYGYWWWALPALLLTVTTIYLSTATGGFYAFTDWTGAGPFTFVGLSNFTRVFETPELLGALKNTLILAFGFLVFTNVTGLLFALALNRTLKTRYLLRTLIFMPVVLSPVAVAYIWKFIFSFDGALNQFLGSVGLTSLQHDWLASPKLALACILVVMTWQNIGFVMVTYLAGLATVPPELEEAAALDGAGVWQRFRHVTLPLIRPAVAIATTLTLIQGLRIFDQVLALTGGGPAGATETLATEVYKETFTYNAFGSGAAMALVLTVMILGFSIVQQYLTRDRADLGG